MKRDNRTYSLREVLEIWLANHRPIGYRVKSAEVLTVWSRLSDQYVTAHSDAASIKDGVLLVKTDSPALANELSLREDELKALINGELGAPIVKRIIFRSGFVQKRTESEQTEQRRERKLSMETVNRVERIVGSVKQQELREVLKKLFLSSAKRGKEQ